MNIKPALVLLALSLALPSLALAQPASPPAPDALAQITARGRALQDYDQAAWHASDAAMAASAGNKAGMGLFIAQHQNGKWIVDFGDLDASGTAFVTVIEAVGNDSQTFTAQRLATPRNDTGFLVAAAHAIRSAESHFQPPQRWPYNVAVLPNPDGTMYVYLYPAPVQKGHFPLGGDERYLISADGATILDDHRMHRTILDLDAAPRSVNGSTMVAQVHNDIFSSVPEDTDVFHVLQEVPPIESYVVAQGHSFLIHTDGTIEPQGTVQPH